MELIGRTFAQYEIISKLGEGGMGEVYKARDNRLGRVVAIKVLPPQAAKDETVKRRFLIEARAASALNHPYILTVFEIGQTEEFEYMVMEFVNGITLRERLVNGCLKLSEALDIFTRIAEGLHKAHEAKIIHRDLKPENIMLTNDGFVKILDFGLAKLEYEFTEKGIVEEFKSDPNIIQGTVGYLAPEMIQCQPADIRSDIFAFGVMLYEALTTHLPFDGRNLGEKLVATLQYDPSPITEYREDLPPEIEAIVNKSIAKLSSERYQTLAPIIEILRATKLELDLEASISQAKSPYEFLEKIKRNSGEVSVKLNDSDRTIGESINKITSSTDVSDTKKIDAQKELSSVNSLTTKFIKPRSSRYLAVGLVVLLALAFTAVISNKYLISNKDLSLSNNPNKNTKTKKSLAVINFENISQDQELKWLERGMAEMLTTNLAQFESFDVVSSQQLYELVRRVNSNPDRLSSEAILEVAQKAQVSAFVTGTILKIGSRIRLTITLQDTINGKILFSDKIDGDNLNDIFPIVDQITLKLADHLGAKPSDGLSVSISDVTTESISAYKHYEQGIENTFKLYFSDAITEFEKAISIDPNFAMAYLQLALVQLRIGDEKETQEAITKATELIERVGTKEKLYIRGLEATIAGEAEKRIELFKEITERFTNDKEAFRQLGTAYLADEQIDKALEAFGQTIKIDPDYLEGHNRLAYVYAIKGNFPPAITHALKYATARPNEPNPHDTVGDIYLLSGQADKALLAYQKALEIKPDFLNFYPYWKIAAAYRVIGNLDEAEKNYQKQLSLRDKNLIGADSIKSLAMIELLRGNKAKTIKYLHQAIEEENARGARGLAVITSIELGLLYLELGDLKEAEVHFLKSQKLLGEKNSQLDLFSRYSNRIVEACLLKLLIAKGELDKIDVAVENFLKVNKNSYTTFSQEMLKLYASALVAQTKGDYLDALLTWQELRKKSGVLRAHSLNIGICLFMLKKYKEAEEEFSNLANQPIVMHQQSANSVGTEVVIDNIKANYYLGKIAEVQEKTLEAKAYFQKITSHWKSSQIPIKEVIYAEKFLQNN
ncbi:MAG: protein kinase [Acidobacteria bacterium]|nr:protein kinase [Acidobacteriota bacterium]